MMVGVYAQPFLIFHTSGGKKSVNKKNNNKHVNYSNMTRHCRLSSH